MRLAPKLTPFYLNLGVLREYGKKCGNVPRLKKRRDVERSVLLVVVVNNIGTTRGRGRQDLELTNWAFRLADVLRPLGH